MTQSISDTSYLNAFPFLPFCKIIIINIMKTFVKENSSNFDA